MSLANYSDLKASIANFLARSDLTDEIPDFISLCEARMSRELDSRSQEATTQITTVASTESYTLPTNFREVRVVKIDKSPVKVLHSLSPNDLYTQYSSTGNGTPEAFSIIGEKLYLRPVPDSEMTIDVLYGGSVSALSDSNTTNTLLTRHPDSYLYGSLVAAHTFLLDEARASQYDALFSRSLDEIQKDADQSRYSSGGLAMKTDF